MTEPCTLGHTCASCGLRWTGPVGELCRCIVDAPVAHDPCAELRASLAAMVRRVRATGGYSTPEQQAEFRAAVLLLENGGTS